MLFNWILTLLSLLAVACHTQIDDEHIKSLTDMTVDDLNELSSVERMGVLRYVMNKGVNTQQIAKDPYLVFKRVFGALGGHADAEVFFQRRWQEKPSHGSNLDDAYGYLFSPESIDSIMMAHTPFTLVQAGMLRVLSDKGHVASIPESADLYSLYETCGSDRCILEFPGIDRLWIPIGIFTEQLERYTLSTCEADVQYISPGSTTVSHLAMLEHQVVMVMGGEVSYEILPPALLFPSKEHVEKWNSAMDDDFVQEARAAGKREIITLSRGQALYLPAGHVVNSTVMHGSGLLQVVVRISAGSNSYFSVIESVLRHMIQRQEDARLLLRMVSPVASTAEHELSAALSSMIRVMDPKILTDSLVASSQAAAQARGRTRENRAAMVAEDNSLAPGLMRRALDAPGSEEWIRNNLITKTSVVRRTTGLELALLGYNKSLESFVVRWKIPGLTEYRLIHYANHDTGHAFNRIAFDESPFEAQHLPVDAPIKEKIAFLQAMLNKGMIRKVATPASTQAFTA